MSQPREIRGQWYWRLPKPEELVQIRFTCPLEDCERVCEGWMDYALARAHYGTGSVRFLTRGRMRRVLAVEDRPDVVKLRKPPEED